jgi:RecA-family ATPase
MINDNILEKTMQEMEKSVEKETDLYPTHISELLKRHFDPVEWVVQKLIPSESIVAISGYPASYKTWLVLEIANKVANGLSLFDEFPTTKMGVLIIDEENGERQLQKMFKSLGVSTENSNIPIFFMSYHGFKVTPEHMERLIETMKEINAKIVIFDSLIRIHTGNENSAKEMAQVFDLLKEIKKQKFHLKWLRKSIYS